MARKFLTPIDMAQNAINNQQVQNLASAPSSPVKGQVYFDTTLNEFGVYNGSGWVYLGSGGGTVTSVSVASANGFAGTVANSTTTPAITVETTVTGLLKGNGTAVSAAVSGTDYAPATSGSSALKGNGSGGFSNATLNDVGSATADYSLNSHKLTNVNDPTNPQDAATKNYVDSTSQGLNVKPSVHVATTGSETFTVTSGNVTQISGTTVDGVSPSVNDRILIKDAPAATGAGSANSTEPGNGIYIVTSNTTNLSLSRATDMSGTNGPAGAYTFVEAGTANASAGYVVSTPSSSAAFTYGTNNIAWTQFSGAGEVTAGTGLSKSGNTISLSTPVSSSNGGAGTVSGILKANGSGTVSAAVSSTDYAPATSGSSILKGNGSGGFSSAAAFTDYVSPGYATAVGNGSSTSITVNHNLGSRDVIVQIYDASSYVAYECDVTRTDANNVTLGFSVAPSSNSIRVVVLRAV